MQQETPNKYRVVVSERAARMLVSCADFLAEAAPEAKNAISHRARAVEKLLKLLEAENA